MTEPLFTDTEEKELVSSIRKWLGYDGIEHFKDIVDVHGSVDASWAEYGYADNMSQWIPRSTFTQEAKHLRSFLKSLNISKDWTDDEFKTHWAGLIEKSIEE